MTSCARLEAKYGATVELSKVATASAMCKVTLDVDRIVLESKLGFFETRRCAEECERSSYIEERDVRTGLDLTGLSSGSR